MNIKETNLFDYLTNNTTLQSAKKLVDEIFADKRLLEAMQCRQKYGYLTENNYSDEELRLILNDIHLYNLIRMVTIAVHEYHDIYKVIISNIPEDTQISDEYIREQYDKINDYKMQEVDLLKPWGCDTFKS